MNYRLVHLKFGPEGNPGFDIAIFTPAKNAGPFPTIINPSFLILPVLRSRTQLPVPRRRGDEFTGAAAILFQLAGYAGTRGRRFQQPTGPRLCDGDVSLHASAARTTPNFRDSSFYPAYPGYDWGVLLGWAWGLSRVVDYLETQPFVDTNQIIALGHSRLGKLVMVATAFDERIALGAPAGSSGAGTGAYRFCGPGRGGKEGIEDMTRKFPYYFVPRLKEFTGQMDKLPFEAYWYIALTAPRPWISIEGTDDQNCVPNAVKQSVLAAKPVMCFWA